MLSGLKLKNGKVEKLGFLSFFSLSIKSGVFNGSSIGVVEDGLLVVLGMFVCSVSSGETLSAKSVAIIVARTLSPRLLLITVPKMIFTSGWVFSLIYLLASLTSYKDNDSLPLIFKIIPRHQLNCVRLKDY